MQYLVVMTITTYYLTIITYYYSITSPLLHSLNYYYINISTCTFKLLHIITYYYALPTLQHIIVYVSVFCGSDIVLQNLIASCQLAKHQHQIKVMGY